MGRSRLPSPTAYRVLAGMGCVLVGITNTGPWAQPAGDAIAISGSSTVGPITELAIKGFQATAQGKAVRFNPVVENGTSAGFREFCSGKTAISNASRPISSKELAACKAAGVTFYELPIGFDAITVVVHPGNTWAQDITVSELKKLWSRSAQNKVVRWNQVRSSWPAQPIKLFNPGRDSGTFDYFTKAITGEQGNGRSDTTSSEDDNLLVKGVANTEGGMGYFGFAYYKANANKLRAMAIVGPKGKVLPSVKTVQNESYQPLSRPMFIYVNARQMAAKAPLRNFVGYMLRNASEIVEKEGSVPLSDMQYLLVENKLFRHVQGSAFAGDLPIGLTLGELLNRSIDQNKRSQFRL
ncbi:MAG: PstS family phosphate ABC transporter substrate-binding protein [Cyanobacteriota bacterium]|nr:PstS family phosphate ABC transporter substrate-binding protein [Cyanobacteriota bacterium]